MIITNVKRLINLYYRPTLSVDPSTVWSARIEEKGSSVLGMQEYILHPFFKTDVKVLKKLFSSLLNVL